MFELKNKKEIDKKIKKQYSTNVMKKPPDTDNIKQMSNIFLTSTLCAIL